MAKLELITDDTCNDMSKVSNTSHIYVEKHDIFNYGVFHYEIPPDKISENDFEYLQSKVPTYYGMYDDHIDMHSSRNAIICKVPGEAAAKVSEVVGIAVGLKTSIELFGLDVKDIHKIGLPGTKEKRLDFYTKRNGQDIEIETKGTTLKSSVGTMISDIHSKKVGKKSGVRRYGFVTLLRKSADKDDSKIFMTDPDGDQPEVIRQGIYKYVDYYLIYFSFILDNFQYNRISKALLNNTKFRKQLINENKIMYSFEYNGKKYIGQCFDKRLILDNIISYSETSRSVDVLFKKLTSNIGKEKYFLGLDVDVIDLLNSKKVDELMAYESRDGYSSKNGVEFYQMQDGVLFIKTKDGSLPEMEKQFTENEVKERLGEIYKFNNNEWHRCGSPCRSREKEGKPCDIKTYRSSCYFHR